MGAAYGMKYGEMSYRNIEREFSSIDRDREGQSPTHLRLWERTSGLPRSAVRRAFFQKVGEFKGTVWIMITKDRICIAHLRRAGASCDRPESVYRRGIALGLFQAPKGTSEKPSGFVVVGIAPDDKRFVTLLIGQRHQRRPIHHNFYAAASAVPIKVLGLES
jgi:hypothetical protein